MPTHTLELHLQLFGLHDKHPILEDIDQFGHGLSWTSWEFLVERLLVLSFLRGFLHTHGSRVTSADISHLRPFHHECLCFHPLIVEVCPARWSQRISDLNPSNGIAIELRERNPRQASPFREKARHLAESASIGACHRPTGTRSQCVLCCLCWRGDQLLLASKSGGHEAYALSSQSQNALSLNRGGSTAGLSEFGHSDSLFVSSATQEDPQSSTALACKFLTSATQENFRSSATPVDSRGSATPDVAR